MGTLRRWNGNFYGTGSCLVLILLILKEHRACMISMGDLHCSAWFSSICNAVMPTKKLWWICPMKTIRIQTKRKKNFGGYVCRGDWGELELCWVFYVRFFFSSMANCLKLQCNQFILLVYTTREISVTNLRTKRRKGEPSTRGTIILHHDYPHGECDIKTRSYQVHCKKLSAWRQTQVHRHSYVRTSARNPVRRHKVRHKYHGYSMGDTRHGQKATAKTSGLFLPSLVDGESCPFCQTAKNFHAKRHWVEKKNPLLNPMQWQTSNKTCTCLLFAFCLVCFVYCLE